MEKNNNPNAGDTNEELDDAVAAADDTGMIGAQQDIAEAEILLGEDGKSLEDEKR